MSIEGLIRVQSDNMETPRLDSINNLEVQQQWTENASQEIQAKPGISERENPSVQLELEVVLTCLGTTYSMCCRDNTKITHIVAAIGFWSYVDCDCFAHLSEYLTFKVCNAPFFNTQYTTATR
jgi:hypothetical protein